MKRRRRTPESAPSDLDLFAWTGEPPRRESQAGWPWAVGEPRERAAETGTSPRTAVSVAAVTQLAKQVLEGAFLPLWVRGEVSDFKAHRNGHWYFCLRDRTAQLRCVLWSSDQWRVPAPPDDGMQVVVRAQPTVYPTRGDLQLMVSTIEAIGDGLWRKALDRARAKLEADGLLAPERKRTLPKFPRRIAVVTSPDGAALHDIVSVARRRCPSVEVVLVAAKVQGEGAAEAIRAAIALASRWRGADTLIVGRGGGAREDLWAFNDERVARALAATPMPTISAVGHEIDVTLCDLVADVRAATPSAAAEAAVPVMGDEMIELRALGRALRTSAERRAGAARSRLGHAGRELVGVAARLSRARRARLEGLSARLEALSPLATLARGYAVARDRDGRTLSSVRHFSPGLAFDVTLRDGVVGATADAAPGPRAAPPNPSEAVDDVRS